MTEQLWEGFEQRECGEHRTLGGRAWCFDCSMYCSPEGPCLGCEVPPLRAKADQRDIALDTLAEASQLLTEGKYSQAFDVIEGTLTAFTEDG